METLELTISNVYGGEFTVTFGEIRLSSKPFVVEQFDHRDNAFDINTNMPGRIDTLVQQLQRIRQINSPICFGYDNFKASFNRSASSLKTCDDIKRAVEISFNARFPWIVLNDHRPDNWVVCVRATLAKTDEATDELNFIDGPPEELLPLGTALVAACKIEGLSVTAVDRHHIYLEVVDRPHEDELDHQLNQALIDTIGVRDTAFTWEP